MFERAFGLTPEGANDLKKAIASCAAANISLMLPVGLLLFVVSELLAPLLGGKTTPLNVWLYTGLAGALVVVLFLFQLLQYRVTFLTAYEQSAKRRISLAEKLRTLPLSFFGKKDLTELSTTLMKDCTSLEAAFSHCIPELFGGLISVLLMSVGMMVYDWRMTVSLLASLPICALLLIGSKGIQDKHGKKSLHAKLTAADGIQECLEGAKVIRAYGMEKEYFDTLEQKLQHVVKTSLRSEALTGTFVVSSQAILRLGLPIMILVGTLLLSNGSLDHLKFIFFLFVASRVYDPLTAAMFSLSEVYLAQLQIARMKELESQPVQTGSTTCRPASYDIHFDKVHFSYEQEPVLNGVTFTAHQGQVTAIVGPSGSGKSTVAKLAARFWDTQTGKITLGGTDISTIDPEALLQHYAIVFQEVVLFHDTILANIKIGNRNATEEEVRKAAKAAGCDEFIQRLPQGYHTIVGENGSTLSGGERQRISIARALLKDAPIILLDEATASLDVENEALIQSALSRLIQHKTVIIIAHRLRTVKGADQIVVLQEGRVAQQGNHEALLKEGGLYRSLFELQTETTSWNIDSQK